jgi:hypothetical protein
LPPAASPVANRCHTSPRVAGRASEKGSGGANSPWSARTARTGQPRGRLLFTSANRASALPPVPRTVRLLRTTAPVAIARSANHEPRRKRNGRPPTGYPAKSRPSFRRWFRGRFTLPVVPDIAVTTVRSSRRCGEIPGSRCRNAKRPPASRRIAFSSPACRSGLGAAGSAMTPSRRKAPASRIGHGATMVRGRMGPLGCASSLSRIRAFFPWQALAA